MTFKEKGVNFFRSNSLFVVTFLYFFLTLLFTFPLVSHMGTEIPQGRGDVFQAMANIDSRVATLSSLDSFDTLIFLMKGIGVYSPYVVLNTFLSKYLAYNILFFSSFVLSGIGVYLLALYFTKNKYASFLAGMIFAFSPFHFYQSTVVNLGTMHQEWIPFLVLFLFKFFEKLELKYFLTVSFFAFLIAMNEHQMLAFSVLFILAIFIYKILLDRTLLKNKKLWIYIITSLILLVILAFSLFGSMLKVATSDNNFLNAGENAANKYSIKVLDPIVPPIFHSLWPRASESLQRVLLGDTNRGSYFIGFFVLAILLFFLWGLRKRRVTEMGDATYRNDILFWSISTFLFYLFSLGKSVSLGTFTLYLPYYLIYTFLPFYENIRTTGRIFVFALLGLSILFAYGFVQLLKIYSKRKWILVSISGAIILLEFWVSPIKLMTVSYSSFYDTIGQENEEYRLIEIPGATDYEFASYNLFLNTIGKKSVLNGMPLARKISKQFEMQQTTPVIKQLLYTIPKGNDPEMKDTRDIIDTFDYTKSNEVLSYYNVRYITINKNYTNEEILRLEEKFIHNNILYTNRFEDDYLIAYRIKEVIPSSIYFDLGNSDQFSKSFYDTVDEKLSRVVGDGATLEIVNMSPENKKVKILVSAKESTAPLRFSIESKKNKSVENELTPVLKTYSLETELVPGKNTLLFHITDNTGASVGMSNTKKFRQGMLIIHISVVTEEL